MIGADGRIQEPELWDRLAVACQGMSKPAYCHLYREVRQRVAQGESLTTIVQGLEGEGFQK